MSAAALIDIFAEIEEFAKRVQVRLSAHVGDKRAADESSGDAGKKVKKPKKEKSGKLNSYQLFLKHQLKSFTASHPEVDPAHRLAEIAKLWKGLPDLDKAKYSAAATELSKSLASGIGKDNVTLEHLGLTSDMLAGELAKVNDTDDDGGEDREEEEDDDDEDEDEDETQEPDVFKPMASSQLKVVAKPVPKEMSLAPVAAASKKSAAAASSVKAASAAVSMGSPVKDKAGKASKEKAPKPEAAKPEAAKPEAVAVSAKKDKKKKEIVEFYN